MDVWIILAAMVAGALISEMYHARIWAKYQQGKREGYGIRKSRQEARK